MPIPAYEGPFLTKIVVWMRLPIRVRALTSLECMIAVCRLPCSAITAMSMAWSRSLARTIASTGIISSTRTKGWSKGTSAMISRTPGGGSTPIARRITGASLPIQPVTACRPSTTRSARRAINAGSRSS